MASADSIGPTKTGYRLYSGCKDGRVAEAIYDLKVIGWCLPKAPHSASHPLVDLTVIVTIIPGSTDLTRGGIRGGSLGGLSGDQPATRRRPRQYMAPSQATAAHDTYFASARVIWGHQLGFFSVDPPSVVHQA
ncbi:hypothetical protein MRS44_013623 [Fusarium solani]|uniref:uncharacterized protein n=1 Tax=Fusarium solani TaxID=169388 RepID=UPI0032C4AC0B|nr:hypothetical protein MRS44_013623 [Fusarium solani]